MGVLGPAAVGTAVGIGLGWRPAVLVVTVLVTGLVISSRGAFHHSAPSVGASAPPGGRLPAPYWHAWVVLVLCVSVEFATTIWASQLLIARLGMSTATATAAITTVIVGMTLGRAVGGRLTLGRSADRLLLGTVGVALVGYLVVLTARVSWLAVLGLGIVGLGIALQFPLNVTRLIAASQGRPDLATARQSLGAGVAIGLGPFALGALADTVGVGQAFLLVPVLLVLAGVGVATHRLDRPVGGVRGGHAAG